MTRIMKYGNNVLFCFLFYFFSSCSTLHLKINDTNAKQQLIIPRQHLSLLYFGDYRFSAKKTLAEKMQGKQLIRLLSPERIKGKLQFVYSAMTIIEPFYLEYLFRSKFSKDIDNNTKLNCFPSDTDVPDICLFTFCNRGYKYYYLGYYIGRNINDSTERNEREIFKEEFSGTVNSLELW